jgi:hypothetical protein
VNVDWLIPCRYAEVHDNLATIVGAGIDTFWQTELPVGIQVAFIARLQGLPEELTEDVVHDIRQIVTGPDGTVVGDASGEAKFGLVSGNPRADWLQGLMMPLIVGFEASQEGTYTFELIIDSSSRSVPLHVVHGAPPQPLSPSD